MSGMPSRHVYFQAPCPSPIVFGVGFIDFPWVESTARQGQMFLEVVVANRHVTSITYTAGCGSIVKLRWLTLCALWNLPLIQCTVLWMSTSSCSCEAV